MDDIPGALVFVGIAVAMFGLGAIFGDSSAERRIMDKCEYEGGFTINTRHYTCAVKKVDQ